MWRGTTRRRTCCCGKVPPSLRHSPSRSCAHRRLSQCTAVPAASHTFLRMWVSVLAGCRLPPADAYLAEACLGRYYSYPRLGRPSRPLHQPRHLPQRWEARTQSRQTQRRRCTVCADACQAQHLGRAGHDPHHRRHRRLSAAFASSRARRRRRRRHRHAQLPLHHSLRPLLRVGLPHLQ